MKQRKKDNSKAKLAWGIILAIVFLASIITSIIFLRNIPSNNSVGIDKDISEAIGLILILVAMGSCFVAYFLLADYENAKGKKGALCMIFYIIVLIPVFIVIFIIFIGRKIFDKIVSTPQKPREKTYSDLKKDDYKNYTVTIKGRYGDINLHWDNNTETWRDSSGNHYISDDEGKTFTEIDY